MIELYYAAAGAGLGASGWAVLVDDDRLLGFSQDATGDLVRAGDVHVGTLRTVDRTRGLGLVLMAGAQEAMLDLPRSGPKLREGTPLLVQVQRPARGTKRAKVGTRILLEGRDASLVLTGSPERFQTDVQTGTKAGADTAAESDQLLKMAEAIRLAAVRAAVPALIRRGRGCVADLLFRFPDALPTTVLSETRKAVDELQRSLTEDPVGRGVAVDHAPVRDWRYGPSALHDMIEDAFEPRHSLPSGGTVLLERGETLTAIDVNTGAAESPSGPERLALEINRDAAAEIARLVRCLNLAGNIVIDFVGMRAKGQQRELVERLRGGFAHDPAQPWIGSMSPIGLVEMSRRALGAGPVERLSGAVAARP